MDEAARFTHLFTGRNRLLGHLLNTSAGASFGRKIDPNIYKHHNTAGDIKRSQGRIKHISQVFAKLQGLRGERQRKEWLVNVVVGISY